MFDIYQLLRESKRKEIEVDGHNGVICIMPLTTEQQAEYNELPESTRLGFAAIYGLELDGVRAVDVAGLTPEVIEASFNHEDAPEEFITLIGMEVAELSGLDIPEESDDDDMDDLKSMSPDGFTDEELEEGLNSSEFAN